MGKKDETKCGENDKGGGNSWKALSSLLAILAVLGGMVAIIRPITMQIDVAGADLQRHAALDSHPVSAQQLSAARVQFAALDTQIAQLHAQINEHRLLRMHAGTEAELSSLQSKFAVFTSQTTDHEKRLTELTTGKMELERDVRSISVLQGEQIKTLQTQVAELRALLGETRKAVP